MQLYTFFNSSASYRVRIALAIKGLTAEHMGVNIRTGAQRSEDFLALNRPGWCRRWSMTRHAFRNRWRSSTTLTA